MDSCLTERNTFESDMAKMEAERELDILLERSDLEGLEKIEGTIFVAGHKVPDTDTVCSSIAYADLLQKLGYDAHAVVLGEINNETSYILRPGIGRKQILVPAISDVLAAHPEE